MWCLNLTKRIEKMARIKQNKIEGTTELWIGTGGFCASWNAIEIPEESIPVLQNMIREAILYGKTLKQNEICKALGV